jgi:hypothetical protein
MNKTTNTVSVVFFEFDVIRSIAIRFWKSINNNTSLKCPYSKTTFYIGRKITRFTMHNLRLSYNEIIILCNILSDEFQEYFIYFDDYKNNIYIYLRR